jgi:acetyltransferase (GNAT) family protein
MPSLAYPMDALRSLQPAIDRGAVQLRPCSLHKDLRVLQDDANGDPRITYAALENRVVQCIVMFLPGGPVEGIPSVQVGVATMEGARKRGLATRTMTQAIEETRNSFKRAGVRRFYIEAIVSTSNEPSKKLCARLLSSQPEPGTDSVTGEPILHYSKLITS